MRRWLLVAGLLLLVSALTVGPAAAVPAPSVHQPELGPFLTITPNGPATPVCTTATFTITVVGGDRALTPTVTVKHDERPGQAIAADRQTTKINVRVEGRYPTFTASYEGLEVGSDTVTATWQEGSFTTDRSVAQVWTADPATGPPTVDLTQPVERSPVGADLPLEVRVGNGSRCGTLVVLINGVEQTTVEKVDDSLYTLRRSRQDHGVDSIEAVWRQPGADPVTGSIRHEWIPRTPVVTFLPGGEPAPLGTRVPVTVTVTGGLPDGSLTLIVTGANPRTLAPEPVREGFAAAYTGTVTGTDTITATWTQEQTAPVVATTTRTWTDAQPLHLSTLDAAADLGASVTLTARFTPPPVDGPDDAVRAQATSIPVRFLVTGANPAEPTVPATFDADTKTWVATWTYSGRGTAPPADSVQAFIDDGLEPAFTSNTVTVTWRAPTVTLTHDPTSVIPGQEHVVTATVSGAVPGTMTFRIDGTNAAAEQVRDGTHPTYTMRYRGTAPGRDTVTATFALGDATVTGTALTVDWVGVTVVLEQATTVSQVDRDLVLTATPTPPQSRGAVVFTATGAGDPVTLRDDTAADGFTATLRRPVPGVDTIVATWEDAGATAASDPVRHEWRAEPQRTLVLAPGGATTCAGNPFDLTVTGRSGDAPVPDLPVRVAVSRDGAPVRELSGVAAATGVASLRDTEGPVGADTLTATATIDGVAVTSAPMTHTWQDCALDVALDPGSSTSTVGSPVSPVVTVRDAAGRPVPNAAVELRISMTGQAEITADLVTDAAGLATTQYRRDVAGTDRLSATATVGQRVATATAEHVWQLGAVQVSVGPAGTSSVAGSPFTVTVLVTAGDRPVAEADVGLFVIMPGQDDLGGAPGRTDANGAFSYTWTRPVAGDDRIDVLVLADDQVVRASTRHHWTAVPALALALGPGGTAGEVNTDFTATATVTVDGRPVPGADVAFVAGPPNRPSRPRTVRTDGAGRAAFTYRATAPGTHTITARVTVAGFPEGSASINRVWRAGAVVATPDPTPELQINPRPPATTTTSPSPGATPSPTPQPGPQPPDVVQGTRCPPDSTVTLTVGDRPLGTVTADAEGNFATPVRVPDLAPGRYKLVASCPPVRVERNYDVVRRTSSTGTSAASASTAAAVLSFFVLLGGQLIRLRSGS